MTPCTFSMIKKRTSGGSVKIDIMKVDDLLSLKSQEGLQLQLVVRY